MKFEVMDACNNEAMVQGEANNCIFWEKELLKESNLPIYRKLMLKDTEWIYSKGKL